MGLTAISHAYPLAYVGHGHAISTQNIVRHDGQSHGYVVPEHNYYHHHGVGLEHGYIHDEHYYDEYVSIIKSKNIFLYYE